MVQDVELEALSGTALARLIVDGVTTAVVPFGSVEHHSGHLPLGADALVADAIGREVARRLGAVLAPTVRVGDSSARINLPGTMSLTTKTLTAVALQLALSLARTGFAFIALVSTHGGNRAALDAAVLDLSVDPRLGHRPRGRSPPVLASEVGAPIVRSCAM